MNKKRLNEGCFLFPQFFGAAAQQLILEEIRAVIAEAPFFTPRMPRTGRPFSVAMTNCGPLGWVSDKDGGYRYESVHPETGKPWPSLPTPLLDAWARLTGFAQPPQACLVNYYGRGAKLGLHRDEDEKDFSAPIMSVSLGDSAIFRLGGLKRRDPVESIELHSGDVLIMGGESRLRYHGVSRVHAGTSDLLAEGGRINLTLRYVG
ncbi:MAG: alpha-ketoglutarate-dependent dioxygenase AlkB [Rhodomicrobiaceae bacterium]